jgi:hypothetical protein
MLHSRWHERQDGQQILMIAFLISRPMKRVGLTLGGRDSRPRQPGDRAALSGTPAEVLEFESLQARSRYGVPERH